MLTELAYRALTTAPGQHLVRQLGRAVRLPHETSESSGALGRVLLVVTVDTEGGFVERGERRVWQGRAPTAFQGYVHGIRNVTEVLDRHGVKGTFFVAPHGRSATGPTLVAVERAICSIVDGGHALGLHVHPSSDAALAQRLGQTFASGSAHELDESDLERLVIAGRALLTELLSPDATLDLVRWGNWALDDRAARLLAAQGFRIDSSAVPGLRDRKSGGRPRYDWSHERRTAPWELVPGLLEVPIATFRVLGGCFRADPIYGALVTAALKRAASHGAGAPRVFVVMTHSTEATHEDGSPTRVLSALDELLRVAGEDPRIDVVRLDEAALRLRLQP